MEVGTSTRLLLVHCAELPKLCVAEPLVQWLSMGNGCLYVLTHSYRPSYYGTVDGCVENCGRAWFALAPKLILLKSKTKLFHTLFIYRINDFRSVSADADVHLRLSL